MNNKEYQDLDQIAERFSSKGYLDSNTSNVEDPGGWTINARMTGFSFRTMRPYFKGSTCLEVACADGEMTGNLLKHFDRVVAFDGSQTQIDRLNDNITNSKLETHVALMEDFKTNELFSTIVVSYVLEHVEDSIESLKHIKQFLAPGGVILVVVPNGSSIHRMIALEMGLIKSLTEFSPGDIFSGHRRTYLPETLKSDIVASGLKYIALEGILFKPLSQKQMEDWFTDEMLEGFYLTGKKFPKLCSSMLIVAENV
jgi:2-polyprenyl-3-methyl-5-hydroxy-6-metoxy-1,4-benzoquinol methylase